MLLPPNSQLELDKILFALIPPNDLPQLIVQPPSTVTSRKSSEGVLGIQSNAFSLRLEKESNANSECRNLELEAKKSSQHIINTHSRSEEVAIQYVRMRTNTILHMISTLGTAR